MWTATGTIYGRENQRLVWNNGPLGWPNIILTLAADEAAEGVDVVIAVPGITRRLNLDDDLAVSRWLALQGMTLTGDLPTAPPAPASPAGTIH
ncbi:hypothetical protein [Frankia sp. AgB32]|uniref:hypothetical protein n=1 Tax=Frankia sp. AgB32 TaxID=631119 RepID=UPI00200E3E5E|nr:hypothetical protein [Frankia sp. AgB32]MCK9898143.1 hypothetical protein [Frankia sp. AgB32]